MGLSSNIPTGKAETATGEHNGHRKAHQVNRSPDSERFPTTIAKLVINIILHQVDEFQILYHLNGFKNASSSET